ncbi:hypothetical protein C8T65DRAFT_645484 [Cerioporus squamosus]|nr:hypothetical protein C8T65DRAFT_645484 [Cerioporus squamosus]
MGEAFGHLFDHVGSEFVSLIVGRSGRRLDDISPERSNEVVKQHRAKLIQADPPIQ